MQPLLIIAIILAGIIALFILFWQFYFLRNPSPSIPKGENLVLSPANGVITNILEFKDGKAEMVEVEKGFFGRIKIITQDVAKNGYIIIIKLHLYNIHWQRAPVNGTIQKIIYTSGRFLNAVKNAENFRCFFENERNEIFIKGKIKCKVVQIAGFIARRIECFKKDGEEVYAGDVLGLINLGSQVALIIPKIQLNIKVGDVVKISETIIGII